MLRVMSTETEPLFELQSGILVPTPHAQGPWGDTLGGRMLAGLVAWGVERDHGDADYQPARLTVDMFRAAPLIPLQVTTTTVRRGHRVRVFDASVHDRQGLEVVRGTVVQLRKGAVPPGTVWAPPEWTPPDPESLPRLRPRKQGWWPFDLRYGERAAWVRELRPFVAEETPTPFLRAALAADVTNGFVNGGDQGLAYINADLTLYLARLPAGEWVGLEVTGHGSDAGVAFGTASMYDLDGRIGHVAVSGVADTRLLERHPGQSTPLQRRQDDSAPGERPLEQLGEQPGEGHDQGDDYR
jgi:hypothetical protein